MKKTIRTIICAAAVVMAAISCQKSIDPANPAEEGKETIDICVNGLMGEYTQVDGTKAELVNTVRVSWKGGETVYVYDGTQCLGSLAASLEGDEDRYAVLSTVGSTHTVSTPASGTTTLTLVYSPLLTEAPAVNAGEISVSLASQNGEKAPFVAYATLDYTGTNITNAIVPFKFATSVIKVNCTGLKPGTAITSATLSNVNTVCKLTLSGTAAPSVSGVTNGTITTYFAADKVNEEGVAVFQIAAPKLGEASEVRVLTIAQGSDEFEYKNFSKKALSAATSVNTVCQLVKALPAGALPGVFSVSDTKKILFSKGNLWYGKVGDAQTATLHFEDAQWKSASNELKDADHVSHFTWSDNVADAVGDSYSGSNLFCDEKNKQSVDGSDKIYYALSTAEWQYLFNYGSYQSDIRKNKYKWATVNGVGGYVIAPDDFTGTLQESYANDAALAKAGNLVFLPAAGHSDGSDVDLVVGGYYWSSTAKDDSNAYFVFFNSDTVTPDYDDPRSYGYSVRLITESK